MILGIDTGTLTNGVVIYDEASKRVVKAVPECPHTETMRMLDGFAATRGLVVGEWFQSYGMGVGADTFQAIRWFGRFEQHAAHLGLVFESVTRVQVKTRLCHDSRAKDKNVNQAIRDLFGGNAICKGTKKAPGPLYGVSKHSYSALGVVLTYLAIHTDLELF